MHPHPRRILRQLLSDHGPALLDQPSRVDAFLADLCGQHHRERFLLIHALRDRIPVELLDQSHSSKAYELRLSQRLQRRYSFSAEAAIWAVESWSMSLDIAPPNPDANRNGHESPSGNHPALSDSPQRVLGQLLTDYGPVLLNEPARVHALLADLCESHSRERFLLVCSLWERLPFELIIEQQDSTERWQHLSASLQYRFGFSAEAAQWALESWSLALETARSGEEQSASEATKALAAAQETARAFDRERAEAVADAHRKTKILIDANRTVNQKESERAAAVEAARIKKKERALAGTAVSQSADEWRAARTAASGIAKEVEGIMLQVLDSNPMTSQEVAVILGKEQEQSTSWLQGLMKAGKVEYEWLKRSPHLPCYRSRKISNIFPSTEDSRPVDGIGAETAARLRAEDQISAEAAVLEKEREQTEAQKIFHRRTDEWLAAERTVLDKTKELAAAEMAAHQKDEEQTKAEAVARLKAEKLAVAEELVRRRIKERTNAEAEARRNKGEWLAAETTARQFVENRVDAEAEAAAIKRIQELNASVLRSLEKRPLTSRELADILGKEQEQIVALLRRFQEAGEVEQVWLSRSPQFPCYQLRDYPYISAPTDERSTPSEVKSSSRYRGWLGMLWLWVGNMTLVATIMLFLSGSPILRVAEAVLGLVGWGIVTGLSGLVGMFWLWIGRVLMRTVGMMDKLSPRARNWLGMLWLWSGVMGVVGVFGAMDVPGITGIVVLGMGLGGLVVGMVGMLWLWLGRVLLGLLSAFVR